MLGELNATMMLVHKYRNTNITQTSVFFDLF